MLLFEPQKLGALELANRVVMSSPMACPSMRIRVADRTFGDRRLVII